MSHRKPPVPRTKIKMKEAEALVRALKTHQVDGIVGERHIMICRMKEAEEKLEKSRDQVRALAARLQLLRETERATIARELHDEFGQTLTTLQLGLSWIARKVTPQQQPVRARALFLSSLVTSMIQSVKRIAVELRPGTLDELGLVKTVQSEVKAFEEHTGIRCKLEINLGQARVNRLGSVAIFRIVQAALTNISRHAHASRAAIALRKKNKDLIVLTVHDNGKGITKQLADSHNSIGIIGMRERVLSLDGTLTLRGSPGKGTTLTVRIPLSRIL